MSLENDFYLALLVDNEGGRNLCIAAVRKDTWDQHQLMDDPDDIEDVISKISIAGYDLESSGMSASLFDIISVSGQPDTLVYEPDAAQLRTAILNEGYTIRTDFGDYLKDSSMGTYEPV